jgi:hypothetical protein
MQTNHNLFTMQPSALLYIAFIHGLFYILWGLYEPAAWVAFIILAIGFYGIPDHHWFKCLLIIGIMIMAGYGWHWNVTVYAHVPIDTYLLTLRRNVIRQTNILIPSIQVVYGVDAKGTTVSTLADAYNISRAHAIPETLRAEFAIALSHRAVLQLNHSTDWILVLEDDVRLPWQWQRHVQETIEANKEMDLVWLDTRHAAGYMFGWFRGGTVAMMYRTLSIPTILTHVDTILQSHPGEGTLVPRSSLTLRN